MVHVFLETYGCQMNEYDSELVRAILKNGSFRMTPSIEDADVVLLNTCAIRESAHTRIYGRLGHVTEMKRKNPRLVVGVLGCMAQSLQDDLLEKNKVIDLIAGPDAYKRLPRLIHEVCDTGGRGLDIDLSEYETYSDIYPDRVPGVNAWIACMRGCDNFCTFCVVPYTRGRERSRSPESVVEEARRLAQGGYKQITLLGQNVNSYQYEGADFADLLRQVGDVEGIERVRFTSPHPKDFPRRLLHTIAAHPNLCKHVHLPLQAGNDAVLERMRRTYTKRDFLELVDEIRDLVPHVALTTDIICGFPGETDAAFEDTLDVLERVEFDSAFVFKYSERRNTIAQRKFVDDVADEVKVARVVRTNQLQNVISLRRNRAWIGSHVDVLIERQSRKSEDDWIGRDDGGRGVVFPRGEFEVGHFARVEILAATAKTLLGHAATPLANSA